MNLAGMFSPHMGEHAPHTPRHSRRYLENEVAKIRNHSKKLPNRHSRGRNHKSGRMVQNQGTAKRQNHPVVCRAVIKIHTEKLSCHLSISLCKDYSTPINIMFFWEKTRKKSLFFDFFLTFFVFWCQKRTDSSPDARSVRRLAAAQKTSFVVTTTASGLPRVTAV